jgi:RHS repeat-associated protein
VTYDVRNRLAKRWWEGDDVDAARVDFFYAANGRESHIDRYADLEGTDLVAYTDYEYDTAGRTTMISHRRAVDDVIAQYDYEYDFRGLLSHEDRSGESYANDGCHADYSYDKTGQLLEADYSGADVIAEQVDEYYRYDANGNRTESYLHGGGYVTGTANQLKSVGTFNYEYDDEGNLVKKVEIATGEVTTFEYSHRNRMVRAVKWSSDPDSGGIILHEEEYTYDAHNRRIRILVDADGAGPGEAEVTNIVYNGEDAWVDFNAAGEVVARYLFGSRIDQIFAQRRSDSGTVWILVDRLGTSRCFITTASQLLNQVEYSTAGIVLSPTDISALNFRFLFTAREYDEQTAWHYFRARFYDPFNGRFAQRDPLNFTALDHNLYRFIGNSLGNAVDPRGMTEMTEHTSTSVSMGEVIAAYFAAQETQLALKITGCITGVSLNLLRETIPRE